MDGTAVERELTDRNKGISNEVREKRYQEYVRGWVEYFRLADMKELLRKTDEWARRRIRAVYWKQWKKIKTKYRMLKALGLEDWKAKELANSRKGYWKMAKVLNQIFSKKIIAKLGYTSMLDYYLIIGYTSEKYAYIDPADGERHSATPEEMAQMVSGSGNVFFGYVK